MPRRIGCESALNWLGGPPGPPGEGPRPAAGAVRLVPMGGKQAGWQHFARAEWKAARDAFAAALQGQPGDPELLDGLGQSLWWLGERDAAIDRRLEAYAAYQRAGDARSAGLLATYLAGESRIDGRDAASAGWLARARRLLAGEGRVPEAGWLAIEEAKRAGDPGAGEHHARVALELAHELGDPDVECMALAQMGRAAVRQGRVEEGVALLDEAMTVALGGEASDPLACGDACCTTLVVCDGLADLQRAAQWCEAVVDFTERRRYTPVQSWCRAIYASVLVRAGDWERAEAVLSEALQRPGDRRRGGGRALSLAVLAELRLREGRSEEAERLLAGLEDEPAALAPLVRLQLERGDAPLAQACSTGAPKRAAPPASCSRCAQPWPWRPATTPARQVLRTSCTVSGNGSPARTWSPRRRCSRGAPPRREGTRRVRSPSSRRPWPASPRSRSRSRRRAPGWPSQACRPPPARRLHLPRRAPRAMRSSGSARGATPIGPPRCCGTWA
jgi:tetratricopeptide (TPR) repeat protein